MMIKLEKEAQECQNKAAAVLEKQRDEEIELVIARLEEEAQSTHAQLSSEFDAKLACVTEQYQAQVHPISLIVLLSLFFSVKTKIWLPVAVERK